jgi:hypothetical protein
MYIAQATSLLAVFLIAVMCCILSSREGLQPAPQKYRIAVQVQPNGANVGNDLYSDTFVFVIATEKRARSRVRDGLLKGSLYSRAGTAAGMAWLEKIKGQRFIDNDTETLDSRGRLLRLAQSRLKDGTLLPRHNVCFLKQGQNTCPLLQ